MTIWCQRQRIGGDGVVAARRRLGQGAGASLRRDQELSLVDALRDRFPDAYGLGGELWTRQSVSALAQRRFGVDLSPTTAGRYLRGWGLSSSPPEERACPLCAGAVARWMADSYPSVAAAALERRAELYWVGRTRLHGADPAAEVVSAVSARGWVRFMLLSTGLPPASSSALLRQFLLRLSGVGERRAEVIVDGSWATAEWPRRLPRRIVLHALPSCERAPV